MTPQVITVQEFVTVEFSLAVEQGEQYALGVLYKNAAGNPVDITGWTAAMAIWAWYGQTPVVSLTQTLSADGQLALGGVAGTVGITILPAATRRLSGKSKYDCWLYDSGSKPKKLLKGPVRVDVSVTS